MGAIRRTEQFDGRIHLRIKCPLDFRYVELAVRNMVTIKMVRNADGCRACHVTRERGGGLGVIALQRETRVADVSVGRRYKKWVETALLSQKPTRTTRIFVPGDPGESR